MFLSGYEPMIVVTHLDLICRDAIRQGRNWEVEIHHKRDKASNAVLVGKQIIQSNCIKLYPF